MGCSLVRRNEKKACLFFLLDEKEPKNQAQLQPLGEKFLIDQFTKRVSAAAEGGLNDNLKKILPLNPPPKGETRSSF
jgi:hypothetical protein